MRNLLILIGSQLQGKTTWVKENKLEDYTLSMDALRLMYLPRISSIEGNSTIAGDRNDVVFKTFQHMLETRMNSGSFIVIDNMNNKESDLNWLKDLSITYGYKMWYKDFRDTHTLEQVLIMNDIRIGNYISEEGLITHYNLAKNLKIHKNITRIENVNDIPSYNGIQFYKMEGSKKVYFIGDIHGCIDALNKFLDKYYDEDGFYIFTGDYVDRGPDSVGVMKILSALHAKGNILLLEGNHEKWVRLYGANKDNMILNKGFLSETVDQFNVKDDKSALAFTRSDARSFSKKLKVYAAIEFAGKRLFASHGGVNRLEITDNNYRSFSASHYINGTGGYSNLLEMYATPPEVFVNPHQLSIRTQLDHVIHGHRNRGHVTRTDKYINLEGSIEQGGFLKAVVFHEDGTSEDITVKSNYNYLDNGSKAIIEFRESDHIKESILAPGLSAFNFTKELFYKRTWSRVTVKARGMFVNTITEKVVARSYDKFFNIGELVETSLDKLKGASYPIEGFEKGNGYLGIVSHNTLDGNLLICSKSTNVGDYAEEFKSQLGKTIDLKKLNTFCEEENVSLVFEVISPIFDPHIIKYQESELILLDIIPNSFVYSTWKYEELQSVLDWLTNYKEPKGIRVKRLERVINSHDELLQHIRDNKYLQEEGFVYRDSNGFMFKYKTSFYNYLKMVRTQIERKQENEVVSMKESIMTKMAANGLFTDDKTKSDTSVASKVDTMKFIIFVEQQLKDGVSNIIQIYENFKVNNPDFLEPLKP